MGQPETQPIAYTPTSQPQVVAYPPPPPGAYAPPMQGYPAPPGGYQVPGYGAPMAQAGEVQMLPRPGSYLFDVNFLFFTS